MSITHFKMTELKLSQGLTVAFQKRILFTDQILIDFLAAAAIPMNGLQYDKQKELFIVAKSSQLSPATAAYYRNYVSRDRCGLLHRVLVQ